MKRIPFLLVLVTLTLSSCSDNAPAGVVPSRLAGTTYAHPLFESQQQCNDYNEGQTMYINCAQTLELKDSNTAVIMFTDILWEMEYTVRASRLTLHSPQGDNLHFRILDNGDLQRLSDDTRWNRYTEPGEYWETE